MFRNRIYPELAAAIRTELLRITIGKRNVARGDTPLGIKGVKSISVENGNASDIHMNAFESAPPNPPE